jgi:hypothetical protein
MSGRALLSLAAGLLIVRPAVAAEPAEVEACEIKFFLDPAKVLDAGRPSKPARAAFGLDDDPQKMSMLFLDSAPKAALHAGRWNVRLRLKEGHDKLEITYKRRYPLGKDDDLKATLADAAKEGFDADAVRPGKYEAELEWGGHRTVTFSKEKNVVSGKGEGLKDLAPAEARKAAIAEMPEKLSHWEDGRAKDVLASAHVYGPVDGVRWEGKWSGKKVTFEVWQVRAEQGRGTEPVVELSSKVEGRKDAKARRADLEQFLRDKHPGWLLANDVLKTELILKRYAATSP